MPAYAHEAIINLTPGSDQGAPGAAVTVALCGHWEHDGACRWPHHTAVSSEAAGTVIHTMFAAPEADEEAVRGKIATALAAGHLDGPTGVSNWSVISQGPSEVALEEQARAARFLAQQQAR